MFNKQITMEQSERDILIEVKTKVELLTSTVQKISDKLDINSADNDNLRSRLDKIEPVVEENKAFRKWIWITLIEGFIGIIVWLINFIVDKI